ncbi:MAG TPA: CopG family transcriptional regulator [Dehalococcoidia bacterium]|nr:CopG family transcriptional regulator [Dehalococcoidia bacterium]
MSKEQDSKAVYVSADIYQKIQERVEATGFGSVDEYVAFVMEEVLKDEDEEEVFSKEEEEEVKKRLRALGYLD